MYVCADGVRELGVDLELYYLGNLRSIRNLFHARKKLRRIARYFDVIHAQYGSACALITSGVSDRPSVVTIRGSDWTTHDSTIGFAYFHSRLARMMTRLALPRFSAVTAVSRRLQRSLAPYAPLAQFLVLPSPIDLCRWQPLNNKYTQKWSRRRAAKKEEGFIR